jgi:hypothetical protein
MGTCWNSGGGSSVTIDETGGRPSPVRRRLLKIEGTVEED